jgi:hypothetical protein
MSIGFASNSSVKQAGRGATLGTATSSFVGVVRVDATTLQVDANGTISVRTSSLTVGSSSVPGIIQADGTSILVTSGVISANIQVASSSNLGTVRPDGTSILVTSGVISIATVRTDNTSISSIAGVLLIASGSNGFGARTVQSSAAGTPSNSVGNIGDIIYQY